MASEAVSENNPLANLYRLNKSIIEGQGVDIETQGVYIEENRESVFETVLDKNSNHDSGGFSGKFKFMSTELI